MSGETFQKEQGAKRYEIVGGVKVENKKKYPWMTALIRRKDNFQFCGGSLIAPEWVISAGHCLFKRTPDYLYVILGVLDLGEKPKEKIDVAEIVVHPQYNGQTFDFDVALLRLTHASQQQPVAMIPPKDPEELLTPGTMATIIGWGALTAGGPGSKKLMHANVPIISNDKANSQVKYKNKVTGNMIAACYEEGQIDACQGDSGGPFVVRDSNLNLVLAGTTSWGIGCAEKDHPGIYANLAVLGDWVRQTIKS
jgi:secreted trypsin-like serine protease